MSMRWLLLTLALCLPPLANAAQEDGADCLGCHTITADVAVHAIFQTVHGALGGGGADSCVGCHGVSAEHARDPASIMPDVSFGPRWQSPPEARTGSCLSCHSGGSALHWAGSEHQREGMACDSCHDSHRQQDPALAAGSQQACLGCHTRVQAELLLPSRHPIAEGKTACSDCHNPHGSLGDASLHQASINDSCQQCHQEKRGPFLWEHPPAAEDCSLCHQPQPERAGQELSELPQPGPRLQPPLGCQADAMKRRPFPARVRRPAWRPALLASTCLAASMASAQDRFAGLLEETRPLATRWQTDYRGSLELGLGISSADSFMAGQYNGLQDQGGDPARQPGLAPLCRRRELLAGIAVGPGAGYPGRRTALGYSRQAAAERRLRPPAAGTQQ